MNKPAVGYPQTEAALAKQSSAYSSYYSNVTTPATYSVASSVTATAV
jgi:hypothetical protein